MADVTWMTAALVPSCPQTGLGASRSPWGGSHEQPRLCLRLTRGGAGQADPTLEHVIQTRM